MKSTINLKLACLLILLALLVPQATRAYDPVRDKDKYEISLNGMHTIKFTLPVKKWKNDANVNEGKVMFTVEGDNEVHTCLIWKGLPDKDYEARYGENPGGDWWGMELFLYYPTLYVVSPGVAAKKYWYGQAGGKKYNFQTKASQQDNDYWWIEVEWTVPGKMREKTLNFTWSVKTDKGSVSPEPVSIAVPGPGVMEPALTQPSLMIDEVGKIGYPWYISASEVVKATAMWKNSLNSLESMMPITPETNGTILLDATVPHYQLHVNVDYKTNDGLLVDDVVSEAVDVPMLHAPVGFKAIPIDDGKGTVKLMWDVILPDYEDIFENDFFLIERSLTGKEEDFESLTAEPYEPGKAHYEIIDETYLRSVETSHLTAAGNAPNPKYRICRSSASQWGWYGNPAAATATARFGNPLRLFAPTAGSADWANEDDHTVKVLWDYLPSSYVADPVKPSGSLLGAGTADNPYVISDASDWETFANWILNENGAYADKCYRLADDITVSTMVGNRNNPFKGTFDGGGHKMRLSICNDGEEATAPFRAVSGATIKHLHTVGAVYAGHQKFGSGLIGLVMGGNNEISSCWSSVNIYSDRSTLSNKDATHGGFINVIFDGSVKMVNCRFDGCIEDPSAINSSGFVGFLHDKGTLEIVNAMMAGSMNTQTTGCATFVRSARTYTLTNCYYMTAYGEAQGEIATAMTNETLVMTMGGWMIDDYGQVVPIINYDIPTQLKGSGTSSDPYMIRNVDDWDIFVDWINTSTAYNNKYYRLYGDFIVEKMVGATDEVHDFKGTFDGNGHTLTLNITEDGSDNVALFRRVVGATIENLHVTGVVDAGQRKFGAGLIGSSNGKTTLKNCWSSVSIYSDRSELSDKDATHGGFIAVHNNSGSLTISNCLFDGRINDPAANNCGGFVGYAHTRARIDNSLMRGNMNTDETGCATFMRPTFNLSLNGSYYQATYGESQGTAISTMTAEELLEKLGDGWTIADGYLVPVMNSVDAPDSGWGTNAGSDMDDEPVSTTNFWYGWDNRADMTLRVKKYNRDNQLVETTNIKLSNDEVEAKTAEIQLTRSCLRAELELIVSSGSSPLVPAGATSADSLHYAIKDIPSHGFHFESSGKVSETVMTQTRQSSVVLTWDTDGDVIDFFEVLRKGANEDDSKYEVIATGLTSTFYEDESVKPLEDYVYKVRSAVDCEGLSYHYSNPVAGACKHTGKVEGRVQYPDGTGVAGLTVSITSEDKSKKVEVTTDEDGHFMAEGLPYIGNRATTYNVTPVSSNQLSLEVSSYAVTFNSDYNYFEVKTFNVTSGHRFSGFVMYEGTSIPVKGAHFMVNDYLAKRNGGQLVETDFEGKFSFYVGSGKQKIQVVKDQHTFVGDGYFKSKNGYSFDEDVDNIYFYDNKTVKLVGRIVGGDAQGDLPLDNNISRNNLGTGVKMVLTLEGDNTSWLVYDNQKPEKSTNDYSVPHANNDGDQEHKTVVHTTRKRMEVSPDPLTGEFRLNLPPVRWKVQQIYSDGYPTLFQDGMVSEVIDLTDCLTEQSETTEGTFRTVGGKALGNSVVTTYNAKYNRIYHAPLELVYKQKGFDTFSYLGDKVYNYRQVDGTRLKIPLAEEDPTQADGARYTFGHPVFSLNGRYPLQLSAVEKYYWNNDQTSPTVDVVNVGGGKVTVQNDFKLMNKREVVQLDDKGEGIYNLTTEQVPYLLKGEDALRTVTMTLEQDGTNYEAKPIRGYVLNIFAKDGARDIISAEAPVLVDILRDPPGGKSYATLSKGSTLKLGYTLDMTFKSGLKFHYDSGTSLTNYMGSVAAPQGVGGNYGIINQTDMGDPVEFDVTLDMDGNRSFYYTINLNQDIQTSSAPTMVGAPADLYIGMVQNFTASAASTIRAIPDSVFQQMKGQLGGYELPGGDTQNYGSLVDIAQGVDSRGSLFHLVRDESLMIGPKVQSTFVHSQDYILKQLIPSLYERIRSLMFIGTEEDAHKKADATKKPVYLSLLPAEHEDFATSDQYKMIIPNGAKEEDFPDEVNQNIEIMMAWVNMIAMNEEEKLSARELLQNYDVDGGGSVSYSEEFSNEYSITNYVHFPGIKSGTFYDADGADVGLALGSILGVKIASYFLKEYYAKNVNHGPRVAGSEDARNKGFDFKTKFSGKSLEFGIFPVLEYDVKHRGHETEIYRRKESFTIAMNNKSHLDVDVYRVGTQEDIFEENGLEDPYDVTTSHDFYHNTDYVQDYIEREISMDDCLYTHSFVYRTRGGATANPWEDARKSQIYHPGQVIDERTKKIENPKVKLDKQSVSGVAYGEPARFTIYLTNESEQPEAATGALAYYNLYMKETSNPNGAKLMIDGQPLSGNGRTIYLEPGTITQKTLEVYAGEDFDYEGLTIGVMSEEDPSHIWDEVSFDVHFLRTAGKVDIASPADKWIMNTDAEYNDERGYFIPVVISGFDKHQKNFDHIEFQYKEAARGDDFWTNLCSYYADSTLMTKANGVKEMIPENGNITTQFYGEGVVFEKAYDLRAVLFCRNGNSFLTTSSKVMSGVKDTRRPQLFGTPEPMNGILAAGENIVFNFSEDIEYNYLSAITNFEVKGEVNNDAVTREVTLQFDGNGGVQTEAERNFADKDITIDIIIRPDQTGREMPLFSHGSDGKKLQLWLTADNKLKAVVNEAQYLSKESIDPSDFTQVAMVIQQPKDNDSKCTLDFYNGGKLIGSAQMDEAYTGTGVVMFGSSNEANPRKRTFYKGRMMEARLWYRALDGGLIGTTYGYKRLTGYEKGLMDYWPMTDGSGDYVIDKAQGANLQISNGVAWAKPGGMSLHLAFADKGMALKQEAINRTSEQDYTLMFWFKTDSNGRGALISNGSGHAEDEGAANQFFIGFESDKLLYRTNGIEVPVPGYWSDGDWHHYAMTVNRGLNVLNIYVDQTLRASIEPERLGGISGGHLMLGNCIYNREEGGKIKTIDSANYLEGNIDELCLFDQALPLTLIKSYSNRSPQGDEAGLISYLGFQRQERTSDNDIETHAYAYSKKIYKDKDGNLVYERDPETKEPTTMLQRDYLFEDAEDVVLSHIDESMGAPVMPEQELHNLNFSFVGRDHSLLLNINNSDDKINKRNIYVTLREIPDKNGNNMASAATACFFVDRNPLRWSQKTVKMEKDYGVATSFEVAIQNNSQVSHTYTIENYPKWLTVSPRTNTINPTEEQWITFTVNKDLNVGKFDEIIYLTDENGLSEPIVLSLSVSGIEPEWTKGVDRALRQHSMNITARVMLNNEIDVDPNDIVGVFDAQGVCHGLSNISYNEETGESFAFITVYDSLTTERPLNFRLWNHSIGREQQLTARDDDNQMNITIQFSPSKVVGSPSKPLLLIGGEQYIQNITLVKGWNWVSFNLQSDELNKFSTLLDKLPLHEGDIMTDYVSGAVFVYTNGHWMISDSEKDSRINNKYAYFFKVQEDVNIQYTGSLIKQKMDRTITLGKDWNSIGYTPMLNLTVETALSDYYSKAKDGDVIKSHDEYAIFTEANGVGQWKGSLKYMKPGEGYMLFRTSSTEASFTYPFYEPTSTFLDEVRRAPRRSAETRSNMSVTARVNGVEVQHGDRLVAYVDGDMVGETIMGADEESLFYLTIGGDEIKPIWFALERDGDIIASTSEIMTYKANAIIGKPEQPAAIDFTTIIPVSDGWYTVSGVKLDVKPNKAGVYIHNGKKVVIK